MRLEKYGKTLNPDIVIYTMFPGNDIIDNYIGNTKTVKEGYLRELGGSYRDFTYLHYINKRFEMSVISVEETAELVEVEVEEETYSYLDAIIEARESTQAASAISELSSMPAPKKPTIKSSVYSEEVFLGIFDRLFVNISEAYRYFRFRALTIPFTNRIYRNKGVVKVSKCAILYNAGIFSIDFPKDKYEEDILEITHEAILKMQDYVENELGAVFVLSVFPLKEQVNEKMWQYEIEEKCIDPKVVIPDLIFENLKNFAQENEINIILPINALKAAYDSGKDPHFKIDSHINKHGHEVVFEYYKEELDKLILD
ncbi:hypothetical protein ACFLZK_00395 [Patescibacteria group bacterium]